jgi:outer membrane protein
MKIITKFLYVIIFFTINISQSFSYDKVAFINLELMIENTNYGKTVLLIIDKENEKNIKELSDYEIELKSIEDSIKQKKNILSNEEYNKEIVLLKNKISAYKKQKNDIVNNFTNFRNDKIKEYFIEINPVIQDYMKKNSISILLEQKNVFMGKTETNITSDLIKIINENIKK